MTYFLLVVVILQLAFPDAVYLVDAIEGGKELIQACKPALESDHVTKVIHDCKRDSEVPNVGFENF
jgi:exonuclease 3'-5' domain-containing protein 1